MKVRIGTFSIDFNEEAIRTAKKEAYIRDTARSLAWTGLDEKTLTQRIPDVAAGRKACETVGRTACCDCVLKQVSGRERGCFRGRFGR